MHMVVRRMVHIMQIRREAGVSGLPTGTPSLPGMAGLRCL